MCCYTIWYKKGYVVVHEWYKNGCVVIIYDVFL